MPQPHTTEGRCISGDATFKIGGKSTLSDSKGKRSNVMKGGINSLINEHNEIIAWVRGKGTFTEKYLISISEVCADTGKCGARRDPIRFEVAL